MLQGKRQDYQAALCTGLSLTMQRRTSSRAQQTRLKQQKRSWRGRTRHPPSPAFHLVCVSVDHNIYIKVKGKNCTTLSEMGKDPGKCLEERSGTARVESMLPKGQRGLKKKKKSPAFGDCEVAGGFGKSNFSERDINGWQIRPRWGRWE